MLLFSRMFAGSEGDSSYNPDWANVTFLYSWEDIIGSPVGESDDAHGLGNVGTTVDSSRKLFGKNSTHFNNADWVNTVNGNVFELRTGDFVVETFVYISEAMPSTHGFICGIYDFNGYRNWIFRVSRDSFNNTLGWTAYPSGSSTSGSMLVSGPTVPKDQWVHIAAQRVGDDHVCFVDGVPGTVVNSTVRPSGAGTRWMTWGQTNNAGNQFAGNLAESRITQGETFYPMEGFTPPTAPYPRS